MKRVMLFLGMCFALGLNTQAQFISIVNKKFVVNGKCQIYFNGANTPWEAWNDFGGSYNRDKWNQDMIDLKSKGINAARIWFSCNGDGQPSVATDGTASAPTAAFWKNCDSLFAAAKRNGVYIMATMMSFDHTKTGNNKCDNWRALLNSSAKTQTYIDNYLVPFVNRYKTNPSLWSIDICNEIEWIAEDGTNWKCSYDVLQRFVAQCAAALHGSSVARADGTKVLVTLGSAATKWNATKGRTGSYSTGWGSISTGNKWSDAALQSQLANTDAHLDFYSPHFYGWINEWYGNMFEKSPTDFGMDDKLCMVGEMPARDSFPIPSSSSTKANWKMIDAMNALKTLGWHGHMPWTANITVNLTEEVGSLADFGAAALAFKNANADLVYPNCPLVECEKPKLGTDKILCLEGGSVSLSANLTKTTNKTYKWYNGTSQLSSTASSLTVTTAGTYILVVDSASGACVNRDTVVITSGIPTPALTDVALCSPASATLDAGVSGAAFSFKWYADQVLIDGATASTLSNVRKAGTYKVEVSASGCSAQSASAVITSSLPTPVDACSATAGTVDLSIANATGTNFAWFAAATGGTALGTGLSFKTPSISTTTTYYVQDMSAVSATFGKTTQSSTQIWGLTGADYASSDKKQTVSIQTAVTLKSVNVYVNTAGDVTIRVLQSDNTTVVAKKTYSGLAIGLQTLANIDIDLPVGDYIFDAAESTAKLNFEGWTSAANYTYPYTAPGVASLSYGASWGNQGYGPFYSITVAAGTNCARLPVVANVDASCGGIATKTQNIHLSAGWNLISFNVVPSDKTIEKVFAPIISSIIEIKTFDAFWRNGQSSALNSLTSINDGDAYLVNLSADATISLTGIPSALPRTFNLQTGWNMLGVPAQSDIDISTAVGTKPIESIKDFDGFWQATGVPSLSKLMPTKAYFIKAGSTTTVSY